MRIPCKTCGHHDLTGTNAGYMAYMICLHVPRQDWAEAVEKCPPGTQEEIKAYLRKQWHRFAPTHGAHSGPAG